MDPEGPNQLRVADLTNVTVVGRSVDGPGEGKERRELGRPGTNRLLRRCTVSLAAYPRRSDKTGMSQAELRDERSMSGGRTVFAVLAAPGLLLCLGVGCGGDPSAPSTSPGPAASPPTSPAPPPAPAVRALTITTAPFDPRGYAVSETIGVQVTFSEAVTVSGSPLLKLGIGENVRDAVWNAEASDGAFVAFRYVVTLEDRDEDGISIGVDALDASDGMIESANGVQANLSIGDQAIADDGNHLVLGSPPEAACADQRELAMTHTPIVVSAWDGTPFRVDIIRNFPEFVTDADLEQLLAPIGRLADQIETQLGYRIVEMGGLVEVPAGAPEGWDQDYERYWRNRLLISEPGELLAFYLNDDNEAWGGEGSMMSAHLCCGTTSYNKRALGLAWAGDDPCCQGDANQYTREGETITHEVFHLLGFKHYFDQYELIGVQMSAGALDRPWRKGSLRFHATWTDIENLRCIFPEGG